MRYDTALRAGLAALLVALLPPTPPAAQPARSEAAAVEAPTRLPAAVATRHRLELPDRSLAFTATAGALVITDDRGREEAEIGFVAYVLETADGTERPVTFAMNGGPGAAAAYLHLGAMGPWRLPMGEGAVVPSQPTQLVANAETWLDFTDLVFIDPAGTGFSRLIDADDRLRERYLSIEGDIEAAARFILAWLGENGRMTSPTYFVGESYGGFRGPLLAERLQTTDGVGLAGMVLVSPVLDFGWWRQADHGPLPRISVLPSLAAAAMEKTGDFSPEALRAAEDYAAGEYLADLMRGLRDEAAVARIVARVAEITGLDPEVVARHAGRIGIGDFAREIFAAEGRIASLYDAGVTGEDPAPERRDARLLDPVLDGMTAPLTTAMLAHYHDTLGWMPERRYLLLSRRVNRGWDWGGGQMPPEVMGALRQVLALDPELRLLVAHGYTDLVTPYFASELVLRQLPAEIAGTRLRQATYRGGHMFYTRDASRRAFREDAAWLYGD